MFYSLSPKLIKALFAMLQIGFNHQWTTKIETFLTSSGRKDSSFFALTN